MNTLERIRAIDPCAGREPDMERLNAALERIAAAGGEAGPRVAGRRVVAPRLRPRARGAVALAFAASLAGAAVVLSGGERVAPAGAATVLREARAAATRLDGAGPWTVVVTRDWRNEPFRLPGGGWGVAQVPYTIEQWSSDDGRQLSRSTRGDDVRGDGPATAPPADPYDGRLIRRDTSGYEPSVAEIRALPTDPGALAARLGDDAVRRAVGLLLSPSPGAQVRVALYDVLLRARGAELVPRLTDPEGRTGEGVRFVTASPPNDLTLLFDPHTHALLGLRQVNDQRKALGRVLTSWTVVLRVERAPTAPKPELEQRAGNPPEYVPVR